MYNEEVNNIQDSEIDNDQQNNEVDNTYEEHNNYKIYNNYEVDNNYNVDNNYKTYNSYESYHDYEVYDDYIIPDSNSRKLTREELSIYSLEELSYIRNEIFARHGYIFKKEKYYNYFIQKDWYVPNEYFDGSVTSLNKIEQYNVNLIKELEGK
ncbi:MAG: YARHG domain-containing protein [Romboutsia sp.]|nr:YARHG domain-containing protein [Romboutsia sp.]